MKIKRILAFVGALILLAMYASTLVFALLGSPSADRLLMASVACTIIFPVLLYGYILVYKVTREDQDEENK